MLTGEWITNRVIQDFGPPLSNFIDDTLEKNPTITDVDMICTLSEHTENVLLREDLSLMTEGFIVHIIWEIVNTGLIDYYKVYEALKD